MTSQHVRARDGDSPIGQVLDSGNGVSAVLGRRQRRVVEQRSKILQRLIPAGDRSLAQLAQRQLLAVVVELWEGSAIRLERSACLWERLTLHHLIDVLLIEDHFHQSLHRRLESALGWARAVGAAGALRGRL